MYKRLNFFLCLFRLRCAPIWLSPHYVIFQTAEHLRILCKIEENTFVCLYGSWKTLWSIWSILNFNALYKFRGIVHMCTTILIMQLDQKFASIFVEWLQSQYLNRDSCVWLLYWKKNDFMLVCSFFSSFYLFRKLFSENVLFFLLIIEFLEMRPWRSSSFFRYFFRYLFLFNFSNLISSSRDTQFKIFKLDDPDLDFVLSTWISLLSSQIGIFEHCDGFIIKIIVIIPFLSEFY